MKPFKFFQKVIRNFNVYEEMVLGIIDYCRYNALVPYGYTHPFTITTLQGVEHKRIVIRNVTKYGSPHVTFIKIDYDLHREDTVTSHTLEIREDEYDELTERHQINYTP